MRKDGHNDILLKPWQIEALRILNRLLADTCIDTAMIALSLANYWQSDSLAGYTHTYKEPGYHRIECEEKKSIYAELGLTLSDDLWLDAYNGNMHVAIYKNKVSAGNGELEVSCINIDDHIGWDIKEIR